MTREELNTKTVSVLRKLAAEHSVVGRSKMKKAELVDALLAVAQTSPQLADEAASIELALSDTVAPADEETEIIADAPAETEAVQAESLETDCTEVAAVTEVEPSADDVYIDRGEAIPDSYPGERMRVLVRDPGSLYVYWETPAGDESGWEVAAERDGATLHNFQAADPSAGGYLRAPAAEVQRVSVRSPRQPPRFVARLPETSAPRAAANAAREERWATFSPPEERPRETAAMPAAKPLVPPRVSLPEALEPPGLPGSHTAQTGR